MAENTQLRNYILAAIKAGKDERADLIRYLQSLGRDAEAGRDWLKGFKNFSELNPTETPFLIGGYRGMPGGLVPAKAYTAICAPSYNGKTWFALQLCKALATGKELWDGFKGPSKPVPVRYHVPEMSEHAVRSYMSLIGGFEEIPKDFFLVRPMECGLWPLDNANMIASAKDAFLVFDTSGYFNQAEDASNYQQSLKYATQVFNLLQKAGGDAVGAAGLHHPPKYASQAQGKSGPPEWTLENSILGSAGYGGMLRSCLRMKNLNKDLNDENIWMYVQGLKNPGLRPFQLQGPVPLKMKVIPGASPYLSELISKADEKKAEAFKMFDAKKTSKEVRAWAKVKNTKVGEWHAEWEASKEANTEQQDFVDDQTGQEG